MLWFLNNKTITYLILCAFLLQGIVKIKDFNKQILFFLSLVSLLRKIKKDASALHNLKLPKKAKMLWFFFVFLARCF